MGRAGAGVTGYDLMSVVELVVVVVVDKPACRQSRNTDRFLVMDRVACGDVVRSRLI